MRKLSEVVADILGKPKAQITLTPEEVEYVQTLRNSKYRRKAEIQAWQNNIELTDDEIIEFLESKPL